MLKRFSWQSGILLVLAAMIAGQTGPCGGAAPAPGGGGGNGNFVGVWQASYFDPFAGFTTVEMVLQPDGNFSKQSASAAGTLVTITGPYFVDYPSQGLLRLTIFHGEPSEYLGTPIIYPAGEAYNYNFIDNNTLELRDIYCTDGLGIDCTLTYTRAG